ncbi:MAG: YfhO family protein, partial [Bacilli bacterium]
SIPYDKGFKIYLNNKLTDYEKVDTSFIGLPIKSGHYNVKVTYEAPLSKLGQNISIVGIICFIGLTIYDNKKRSK